MGRITVKNQTINQIGKDNNFGESKIYINNAIKIKKQMKKDTKFLSDNNLSFVFSTSYFEIFLIFRSVK